MRIQYLLVSFYLHTGYGLMRYLNATNDSFFQCPEFDNIDFGDIDYRPEGPKQIATVTCQEGYDLDGPKQIVCIDGVWQVSKRPSCIKRCRPPPDIKHGLREIDTTIDFNGYYPKNSLVTYTCNEGYTLAPPESKYRVCEKGIWTGPVAKCKVNYCSIPKDIENGYYIDEAEGVTRGIFFIGQRIHYKCNAGYTVVGYSVLQCMEGGFWSKDVPHCELRITDGFNKQPCHTLPSAEHAQPIGVDGFGLNRREPLVHGTMVEMSCTGTYRNILTPCQPSRLQCNDGKWEGELPRCELVDTCDSPPTVPYATIINIDGNALLSKYPIKAQVTYQCFDANYELQGDEVLTCSLGGCWEPNRPPECLRSHHGCGNFKLCLAPPDNLKFNSFSAFLWSSVTGLGVLIGLMLSCCVLLMRRKKPSARTVASSPPVLRSNINDHATLLNNPDRLALIAFADGVQNINEDALPSYDEAVRRASATALHGGFSATGSRLARPQWPSLAGRRVRNSPNPDLVNVTRHGSFASHSPSTRSGVDSMGSTDTVAISEGSTNITLDTASSHSGSQQGSCRVHCGSLASFDTQSGINTEDAPLLEESELEEVHVNLNGIEIPDPTSDNSSFKSGDVP